MLAGFIFSALLAEITPWAFQAKDDHSWRLTALMAMTPMLPIISLDPCVPLRLHWEPGLGLGPPLPWML